MTSLDRLLDELEAPAPSAAGGTAAAVTAAMAASLTAMVARGARDWPDGGDTSERAIALRARLLELGRDDVEAFAAVLRAYRALRASGSDDRKEVAGALVRASEVPLEIGRCAAEVAGLAGQAAREGKGPMRFDAEVAAVLAEAAARAAAAIVAGNVRALPPAEDARAAALLEAAGDAARRAATARSGT